MKSRPKKPTVPPVQLDTVRHEIVKLLETGTLSALDISMAVHIAEREVYDHLEHIRRTLHAVGGRFEITPAECKKCGFAFTHRERLKKPGKCPVCRNQAIHEPLFRIISHSD